MIVLTAVGKDRPGIASRVTRVLYESDCNIEDASMTILCGEFAILLMLSAPPGLDLRELDERFDAVRHDMELLVALRDVTSDPGPGEELDGRPAYVVSVTGADKPGIVWRVTDLLAAGGANITDLESKVVQSGAARVYLLVLEIVVPQGTDLPALEGRLRELGAEIGVEIHVNPLETAAL
ncbi:MAG: amino acid-binding protein [Candidatus Wallbacteria bacterium]|nr:amino acid-binding protein [Candidatus Wallbacteria bacterium]